MRGMVTLEVYVKEECWSCAESRRIVAEVAHQFPGLGIKLIDINGSSRPQHIFAAPTYVLDGRIISLGNPYRDDLRRLLEQALEDDDR